MIKRLGMAVIGVVLAVSAISRAEGGVFSGTHDTILEPNQAEANFGNSMSRAGDVNGDGYADVVVGAPNYSNGQTNEGAAFVYFGSANGISSTSVVTLESDREYAYLGTSVSGAGDVNGDGYDDIIIGAPGYENGDRDEGAAFVYLGSATGISTIPAIILEYNQISAYLGNSVAGAGDVNKDGYDDIIVGAIGYSNGQASEGAVFLYLGSAIGIRAIPAAILESDQGGAEFGHCMSAAGDVNKDGYDDIIVGTYLYNNGDGFFEGAAFVYLGGANGISSTPKILKPNQVDAFFGSSVSGAGDVNNDGYDDIIVGAHGYDINGLKNGGAFFVYLGSANGISSASTIIPWRFEVSGTGDLNNDGYDDIIVGANKSGVDVGGYVYLGSANGISLASAATLKINQASAYSENKVSYAGDINNDGYADIIIGVPSYSNGQTGEGAAFVYLGGFYDGTPQPADDNNPPSPPVLISPTDNQTGVDTTVTYKWKKSSDPDGDSIQYTVVTYICDSSGASCVADGTYSSGISNMKNIEAIDASIAGGWFLMLSGIFIAGFNKWGDGKKWTIIFFIILMGSGIGFAGCSGGGSGNNGLSSGAPPAGAPPVENPSSSEMSYKVTGLKNKTTYGWKITASDSKGGATDSELFIFTTK